MPAKRTPSSAEQPAIRSMTGFGRSEKTGTCGRACAEVRAVNGRFLKLSVKLPPRYGALEDRVKEALAAHGVRRGSVDVSIWLDGANGEAGSGINAAAVAAYAKQAKAAAKKAGLKGRLSVEALLPLPGVVTRLEKDDDSEEVWARCATVLEEALGRFDAMRRKEGAAMERDIQGRLAELRGHREHLIALAPEALQRSIERFKERVGKLLEQAGLGASLEAGAIEREIVLASDRMDIGEELARLESHFQQMEQTLAAGGETGKKLDFLTQELFRETNTIGSKANDQTITHCVIAMKGLIEKIREQVQNLE